MLGKKSKVGFIMFHGSNKWFIRIGMPSLPHFLMGWNWEGLGIHCILSRRNFPNFRIEQLAFRSCTLVPTLIKNIIQIVERLFQYFVLIVSLIEPGLKMIQQQLHRQVLFPFGIKLGACTMSGSGS